MFQSLYKLRAQLLLWFLIFIYNVLYKLKLLKNLLRILKLRQLQYYFIIYF